MDDSVVKDCKKTRMFSHDCFCRLPQWPHLPLRDWLDDPTGVTYEGGLDPFLRMYGGLVIDRSNRRSEPPEQNRCIRHSTDGTTF